MVALHKPTPSEYTSVENFMNNERPLVEDEGSFIYRKEDLVTLRPGREHAWLDSTIEKVLRVVDCSMIQARRVGRVPCTLRILLTIVQWIFCSAVSHLRASAYFGDCLTNHACRKQRRNPMAVWSTIPESELRDLSWSSSYQ
jgi:hypothetical protein